MDLIPSTVVCNSGKVKGKEISSSSHNKIASIQASTRILWMEVTDNLMTPVQIRSSPKQSKATMECHSLLGLSQPFLIPKDVFCQERIIAQFFKKVSAGWSWYKHEKACCPSFEILRRDYHIQGVLRLERMDVLTAESSLTGSSISELVL